MVTYTFSSLKEFAQLREEMKTYIMQACPQYANLLFVALNEAVNNAIFHGYEQQAGQPTPVEVILRQNGNEFFMIVRHYGTGFIRKNVEKSEDNLLDHGRGIEIIKMCTDDFCYNQGGNEIVMRKIIA